MTFAVHATATTITTMTTTTTSMAVEITHTQNVFNEIIRYAVARTSHIILNIIFPCFPFLKIREEECLDLMDPEDVACREF